MAAPSMLLLRIAEYLRTRQAAIAKDAAQACHEGERLPAQPDPHAFPWAERLKGAIQAAADALLARAAAGNGKGQTVPKGTASPTRSVQVVLSEAWLVRNSFLRALNRFQVEQTAKKVDFTALEMTEVRQEALQEFDRLTSAMLAEWICGTTQAASVSVDAVRDLYDGMRAIQGLLQLAADSIPVGARAHVAAAAQQLGRLAASAQQLIEADPDPKSPEAGMSPAKPAPPAPKAALNLAPLDVLTFVRSLAESSRPGAQRKGLRLESLCNPGPEILRTDGAKLHRAATLLLDYAITLTDAGEVSIISGADAAGHWSLEIRDTSPGIPPEILAKLLKGVAHAPEDASPQGDSRLGIALARDLAHLLGGSLDATSEPGEGNSFILTLPS